MCALGLLCTDHKRALNCLNPKVLHQLQQVVLPGSQPLAGSAGWLPWTLIAAQRQLLWLYNHKLQPQPMGKAGQP
jgi:hypothetical protein